MPGRGGKRCLRHPACITSAPYGARIPPRPWPRRWKLVFAGALTSGVAALIVLRIPDAANLDRWLPRLSLKDSDEPNGAGEDAPADSDELRPVAKA